MIKQKFHSLLLQPKFVSEFYTLPETNSSHLKMDGNHGWSPHFQKTHHQASLVFEGRAVTKPEVAGKKGGLDY